MKNLLLVSIFLSLTLNAVSQIQAITENGDTITVFENGTWEKTKYAKEITYINSTVKATVEVDEFEKTKKITTERWSRFGVNNVSETISGYLFRVDDLTVFSITYSGDLGCLSEYSTTMKVKLTNGNVIEFAQISDTECGDNETARFIPLTRDQLKDESFQSILDENIEQLKQFDWETIRINGSEYYTDISPKKSGKVPNPEQFFRQHIIAADNQ
ncbi:hypothetical protein [Crocinitomix algicola]|uniref:hypothetical protein n=1 Tax=Crocinitomix algicola TaxID=1740263 RepID=UPI000834288C|nr:hypothetical protein [Crocinitomix algicola]